MLDIFFSWGGGWVDKVSQKLTWNVTYYENDSHLRDLKFVTFVDMLSLLKCISYRSCFQNWIRDPNTKVAVAGGRYSFKGGC